MKAVMYLQFSNFSLSYQIKPKNRRTNTWRYLTLKYTMGSHLCAASAAEGKRMGVVALTEMLLTGTAWTFPCHGEWHSFVLLPVPYLALFRDPYCSRIPTYLFPKINSGIHLRKINCLLLDLYHDPDKRH